MAQHNNKEVEQDVLRLMGRVVSTEEGRNQLKELGYVSGTPMIAVTDRVRVSRILKMIDRGTDCFVAVFVGGFLVDGFVCNGRKNV